MIETITCAENITRETISATGVSAISDLDGSISLVWSAEGTSVCVRKCVNGILCDGFKIGSDDLVCDGVTVTASIMIQLHNEESVVVIGFSNGGMTLFTQYGEATEMFAFYNFPVVDLKRAVINDRDVLLVLHSNGLLVIVSIEEVLKSPETASTNVIQIGSEEESRLFRNIEVSCIDENPTLIVQDKTQLLSIILPQSTLCHPVSPTDAGILSGIFNYAKSLVSPTIPTPSLRRRKSSNHSIGLHHDVSQFFIPTSQPPVCNSSSITTILELPPETEFVQLTLSPTHEYAISVTDQGSVYLHKTSEPHSLILTMKGYRVNTSAAWTSSTTFSLLSEKNTVENWKIMNPNLCQKIDELDKIIALLPIADSSITCLMIRQETKSVRFNFSKLLLSQISGPIDDMLVAFILSSFTRHNERQLNDNVSVEEVSMSVEILLIFLRDKDVLDQLTKKHLVEKECEMIELYKQVVDMYSEKEDEVVRQNDSLLNSLSIISNFYDVEKTEFDFESFIGWSKTWPLATFAILPDNLVDTIVVPSRQIHPLSSYREFSHNIDSACDSILSPLVLRQSDPFLIRTVEKIFNQYWEYRGKFSLRTAAVQRWLFSRIRRWFPQMVGNKLLRKFLKQFSFNFENNYYFETLVLLAILDELETFQKLLSLSPIMLRFPKCPPTVVDNWQLLVAVSIAAKPASSQSVLDKLKSVYENNYSPNPNSGQFGIDIDIIDALFEVKLVHENVFVRKNTSDIILVQKLVVLIFLFKVGSQSATPSDIEFLLRFFNDLPAADSDKSVFGFEIISRIFPKLVFEWIDLVSEQRETAEQEIEVDVTALDSCISICRCLSFDIGGEQSSSELIFNSLSDDQIACVERMQFLLQILRISIRCSWQCPIRRLFTFDSRKSSCFPTNMEKSAIIDFLVSLALKSRRGSKLVQQVISELGIATIVYEEIIAQLLDQCFDRDIEEFIHGLTSDQFTVIVDRVVTERIAVCIRMLAEDTSRLHGIIYTILSREDMEKYLAISGRNSEKLVKEWICVDGPRDVLISCTRLVNHPKVNSATIDGIHEKTARKLVRAIDEI